MSSLWHHDPSDTPGGQSACQLDREGSSLRARPLPPNSGYSRPLRKHVRNARMRVRMISAAGLALLGVVLLAPWRENPAQYVHWRDRIRTSPLVALFFGEPCATYKDVVMFDPGPNCYRYGPPQTISGIWMYEFEGATFLEKTRRVPQQRPPKPTGAFLPNLDPNRLSPGLNYDDYDQRNGCYPVRPFALTFIGRRRLIGHSFEGSDMIVDRVVSAFPLPPPDCRKY